MTTPFQHNYAMGLGIRRTTKGEQEISHGGGIEGFNTYLAYFPDDKLTVISLGNLNGPAPQQIAEKIATIVHGGTVELPK
jgi:CubicO group peptidase (beta-lactamase class C family)